MTDHLAQFGVKKAQAQKALDALSEAGKIKCKVSHKSGIEEHSFHSIEKTGNDIMYCAFHLGQPVGTGCNFALWPHATSLAKLVPLHTCLPACLQEFGKTKIYTALQEDGDDLSKEVRAK